MIEKLLPTMGVGSYATPGWMFPFRSAMGDDRVGPEDIAEAFDDAIRVVIADQIEAGVDIISDGELRRQRFVYEMYERIGGIERIPAGRRLGVPGYDMAPAFRANDRIAADGSLGLVAEYEDLVRLSPPGQLLKMALPGPLTFANSIAPGDAYGGDASAMEKMLRDITAMVRLELEALAGAGAAILQLDEPGLPKPPGGLSVAEGSRLINECLAGIKTTTAVHVCFGNNASRPFVRRDFAPLFPGLDQLNCDILLLEFANREMADIELLSKIPERCRIAAGVIDVKNFHVESAEEVAGRIARLLDHVPAARLMITADCGFSAIPRWLAREKLRAMVAGADLARERL